MTQPRLIRLDQWLQIMFGDNPPTRRTIWRWIEAGRIYPAPQKYGGKCYYFDPAAKLIDPQKALRNATQIKTKSRLAA
jgi:hypothetical protein